MPNVCRARYSYNTTDEINEAKTMQLHPILDLFVFTFEKCKTKFYYIIYYTFNTYLINRICAGYSPMHLASVKVTATLILPWSSLNSLYTADGDVGRLKKLEGQTSIFLSFLVSGFYSINCGDVLPPPVSSQFRRPCCTTVTADIITIYLCIWICRRATEYTLKVLI